MFLPQPWLILTSLSNSTPSCSPVSFSCCSVLVFRQASHMSRVAMAEPPVACPPPPSTDTPNPLHVYLPMFHKPFSITAATRWSHTGSVKLVPEETKGSLSAF